MTALILASYTTCEFQRSRQYSQKDVFVLESITKLKLASKLDIALDLYCMLKCYFPILPYHMILAHDIHIVYTHAQTDKHNHTFTMGPVASLNIETFSDNLSFVSDDEQSVSFISDNPSPYCKAI